ncbi:Ulp1 protease family protein [Phlyctema vagabunda]|uniref:Ulp1 protease family protein n=1 Tax=Phlyctema vagabunda TaxID=108571 RepID=A0ABR4PIJ5_9HELO
MDISDLSLGRKRKTTHDSDELVDSTQRLTTQKQQPLDAFAHIASLDIEQVSGVRLPPLVKKESRVKAIEGANHKRAQEVPSYNVLNYGPLRAALQQCTQEPQHHHRDPYSTASPSTACRRRRSLSPNHGSCVRVLEHEDPEMFERSSRLVKPIEQRSFPHSPKHIPIQDLTSNGSSSSRSPSPEIQESQVAIPCQDENEDEGELVDVQRVKDTSPTSIPRAQHISAGQLSPSFAVDPPLPSSTKGNARDQNTAVKDLDNQGRACWSAYSRYTSRLGGSLPDFGGPQSAAAVSPTVNKMKKAYGAPQPRNTLINGARSANGPVAKPQTFKHFDLYNPSGDQHKDKKQRVYDPKRDGSSAAESIDLDGSDTSQRSYEQDRNGHQSQGPVTSRRSSQQNTMDGQPSPYRTVVERAAPKPNRNRRRREIERQHGGVSDGLSANSKSSSVSTGSVEGKEPLRAKRKKLSSKNSPLEDSDDPIAVESESEGLLPNRVNLNKKSSQLQVVLESRSGLMTPAMLGSNKESKKSQASGRSTGISSTFFAKPADTGKQSVDTNGALRNSIESITGVKRRQSGANVQGEHGHTGYSSTTEDAISPKLPKNLLQKEQPGSDFTAGASEQSKARATRALNTTSGAAAKNGSKTNSSNSKTSRKSSLFNLYVQILVSERKIWLYGNTDPVFKLQADLDAGTLVIFDVKGSETFTLMTDSISQIQLNKSISALFIKTHRDNNDGIGTNICLKLVENDRNPDFIALLMQKATKPLEIDEARMRKIFATTFQQARLASSIKPRKSTQEESEEVQFLEKKLSERKARGLGANQVVPSGNPAMCQSIIEDSADELAPEHIQKGLSKRMQRDSTSSAEETQQSGRASSDIPSTEFKSEPRNPRSTAKASSQRSKHHSGSSIGESEQRREGVDSIKPAKFYSKDSISSEPIARNPHETRSSAARNATTGSAVKLQAKQRSPSPERWTHVNRGWAADWRGPLVYPREGKRKATVDMQDIERLDEGEFLNDNIIAFYLRWLECRLERENAELAKRIYFHNTFFFTTLTKGIKGQSINYEAVQRWTAKIDLLSYDYIIVPVNEATHWYVMIICNTPKLLEPKVEEPTEEDNKKDQDSEEQLQVSSSAPNVDVDPMDVDSVLATSENISEADKGTTHDVEMTDVSESMALDEPLEVEAKQPELRATANKKSKKKPTVTAQKKLDPKSFRIIALDSLLINRSATSAKLRNYISAEIEAKQNRKVEISKPFSMNANTLPQQNNYYDCGVFLLEYIEKFLEGPDEFIQKLVHKETAGDVVWRQQSEMRTHIRQLILGLQQENALEPPKPKKERKLKRTVEKSLAPPPNTKSIITQGEEEPATKIRSPQASSEQHVQVETKVQPPSTVSVSSVGKKVVTNNVEIAKTDETTMIEDSRADDNNHPLPKPVGIGTSESRGMKKTFQGIFHNRKEESSPRPQVSQPNQERQTDKPSQLGRSASDAVLLLDSPPRKASKMNDLQPLVQNSAQVSKSKFGLSPGSDGVTHSDTLHQSSNQAEEGHSRTNGGSGSDLVIDGQNETGITGYRDPTSGKGSVAPVSETIHSDWAPDDQIKSELAKTTSSQPIPSASKQTIDVEETDDDGQAANTSFVRDVMGNGEDSQLPRHIEIINSNSPRSVSPSKKGGLPSYGDANRGVPSDHEMLLNDSEVLELSESEFGPFYEEAIPLSAHEASSPICLSGTNSPERTIPATKELRTGPFRTQHPVLAQPAMSTAHRQQSKPTLRDAADAVIVGKNKPRT